MAKNIFIVYIFCTSVLFYSFSQSKKAKIEILTNRVDSLNQVVNTERQINLDKMTQINSLNSKIVGLESDISNLNKKISGLETEEKFLNAQIAANKTNLAAKDQELDNLRDSLALVRFELEKLKPATKPVSINNTNTNTPPTIENEGYKSVKIGTQTWMTENLNVERFRNGDLIPQAKTDEEWKAAGENKQPAWCYYNNDPANGAKYGKLYNWFAVNDSRGLAPTGYHIPTDEEWSTLTNYLGEDPGIKMKSKSGWNSYTTGGSKACPNCKNWNAEYRKKVACHTCKDTRSVPAPTVTHSGNGTNSSGFSGLPGGICYGGTFNYIGKEGYWWSSSEDGTYYARDRTLNYRIGNVDRFSGDKTYGFSVRCLRD
jgi:uncharacterized protein (TIGR02145 family)